MSLGTHPSVSTHATDKEPLTANVAVLPPQVTRLLLLVALSVLITGIPLLYGMISGYLPNIDICAFGIAAKEVLSGGKLYRDIQEWKPPLATVAYIPSQYFAPGSLFALQTLFGVFLIAEAFVFIRLSRATLITALSLLAFVGIYPLTFWDFCWPSTEHLSNLFVGIQLFLAFQIVKEGQFSIGQCFAIGTAASLAFHLRQNAVVPVVVPVLAILMAPVAFKDKVKGMSAILVGGLFVLLCVIALVLKIGDLHGYWTQVFVFPSKIAKLPAQRWVPISFILSQPFVILTCALATIACTTKAWRLVLVSLPVGLAYCLLSPKPHFHYWVNFFPFVALYIVIAMEFPRPHLPAVRLLPACLVLACSLLPAIPSVVELTNNNNTADLQKVADKVDSLSAGRSTLYVTGPMESGYIEFVSKLHPPTPIAFGWIIDQTQEEMIPASEIIGLFLKSAPDIYVINQQYLKVIESLPPTPRTDQASPSLLIAKRLLTEKPYVREASVSGYVIFSLAQ